MDGNKLLDFLIPRRKHERIMNEMKTKQEAYRAFNALEDEDKMKTILSWLSRNGYDIDANHTFEKVKSKPSGYSKEMTVNGINIQVYGFKGSPIYGFYFYTKSGKKMLVVVNHWAQMFIGYHEYPTSTDNCIIDVSSMGSAKAAALESYIINEPAIESAGAAIAAISLGILGLVGAYAVHKDHVNNKKTRQEIEEYLQSKGVRVGDDRSISQYQDKVISAMTQRAVQSAKKVTNNAKFKSHAESIVKARLDKIRKEEEPDDPGSYWSGEKRTWFIYSKGMLVFNPKIEKSRDGEQAIVLVDTECRLVDEIYGQEAGDDNAPEYLHQIIDDICEGVGKPICQDLQKTFADDIAAGLINVEYVGVWDSCYLSPAILISPKRIPGRDGKYHR